MGFKCEVLLVTDVSNLPSSIIMWATKTYGERVQASTALTVCADILQRGSKLDFETSSVDVVISLAETPGFHNWAWLLEVSRVLKVGGDFKIQEPLVSRKPTDEESKRLASTPAQDKVNLERSLLLAGFVNVEMEESMDGVGLSNEYKFITPNHISSINGPLLKPFAMKACKPKWNLGSTFAIKKKVLHSHSGPRLNEQCTYDGEKDQHIEATTQTEIKYYRDVNVSAQIVHDQNDRYLDPYHQTYDQQTEVMARTKYNYSKDMLTGGDTPLHTNRGALRIPSPDRPSKTKESPQMPTNNQLLQVNKDNFQPMPNKQIFKLDLSRVCANEDNFELTDDDDVFTDEDNNSSLFHESNTCRASKRPCSYCLSRPYALEAKQQQTDQFSFGESSRIRNTFNCAGCAICSKSPTAMFVKKVYFCPTMCPRPSKWTRQLMFAFAQNYRYIFHILINGSSIKELDFCFEGIMSNARHLNCKDEVMRRRSLIVENLESYKGLMCVQVEYQIRTKLKG